MLVQNPDIWIPAIGATLVALLLGFIFVSLSVEDMYFLFLLEFIVAFALVLKYLVQVSNFTDMSKLKKIFIASITVVYVSNQYFQYQIITERYADSSTGFFDFMKMRLEQGFQIESLNTGWIGYMVVWIFQLILTYWIGWAIFVPRL
ncbi:MAG: hypothetical protein LBE91_20350 [Tannerella sp.]|jgi:hypothetical protein|nr:hypothetical protein [Tannerella sp.]